MSVISIRNLTKDYGNHKGVFDVSFEVHQGEVLGFLGPNGSGKTTTIRHLMGFMKQNQGQVFINGRDCFLESQYVQNEVGYLPGEIAFMDDMTGDEFIRFMAEMKNIKDMSRAYELMNFLELDASGKIKKMSKGMKQKIGLVIAFMQDTPILILDEPTSGLDPLMQNKFVELIQKSKKEGKTIFMSSHIFEEVEKTCDRVVMIKDGEIVAVENIESLKNNKYKHYDIVFNDEKDAIEFQEKYECVRDSQKVSMVWKKDINLLIKELSHYHINDLTTRAQSLEEIFLHYYGGKQSC